MQRMRELIAAVNQRHPTDLFFDGLDQTLLGSRQAHRMYNSYDRAFQCLDITSWEELKNKAIRHFLDHRPGQLKQGFFNQANDAFAYQLLRRQGCSEIRVLPEFGTKTPDIEYRKGETLAGCEVKTLGISEDLITRRDTMQVFSSSIYYELSPGYLNKFAKTITQAREQLLSCYPTGLVFLVVHFDDFTMAHYSTYRRQLKDAIAQQVETSIYVKIGLFGNRRIEHHA